MRVVVDLGTCMSNGVCMSLAPDVFELRHDNVLHVLQERPPEELRALVTMAAQACPTGAITIED